MKHARSHYIVRNLRGRRQISRRPIFEREPRSITRMDGGLGTWKIPRRYDPYLCVPVQSNGLL